MADNTVLDVGSGGDTIATDDISAVKYQRVKLIKGADGVNDGDIADANAFPVEVRTPNGDSAMDDVNDAVNVNVVAGGGTGGTAMADDGAFTVGSSNVTPAGAIYKTSRDSVDDGDAGAIAMTAKRGLLAALETPDGDSAMDDTNDAVKVNIVAGGSSGGTSMVDDAAFTAGTTNVTPIAGRFDDASPDSVDENDAGVLRMTANRALHSTIRDAAGNERGANVDASNQLAVTEANSSAIVTALQSCLTLLGIIDNFISGSRGLVTEDNSAAIQTAVEATQTAVELLDDAISGTEMQVDVVAALPAGDNNIGNVDVASHPSDTFVAEDGALGKGILAQADDGTDRHNLACDSSGRLQVDLAEQSDASPLIATLQTPNGDSAMDEANDAVQVNVVAGGGTGGTAMADDGTFTAGTTNMTPVGGFYKATRDPVDSGDVGALAMTQNRTLLAALETPNGDSAMDDTNDAVKVNVVAGGGSGGTSMVDDSPFSPAGSSMTPMGAMFDDVSPDSVDENDAGVLRMSGNRALHSTIRDAAGNERGANVDASNQLAVAEANSAAIKTAVEVIDNPVSGNEMLIAGGATQTNDVKVTLDSEAVVLGAGSAAIGKLAANDGTDIGDVDVASLPSDTLVAEGGALGKGMLLQGDDGTDRKNVAVDATSGNVQVDVATALPAGTNNIGDVDVLSVPAPLSTTGGGTEATALRVTVANDSTGVLSVDDNGSSLTVDNAGITTIAGAVSGSEMQVDVVAALPAGDNNIGNVDIASALPAGTNAIGKLAANSGVDIGDVDVASHPSDTFVAEDGALGKGILLQGDDGTDRHNIACDTSGRIQVDIAEQSDASALVADVTGQGDVPITLDGEVPQVQGDAAEDAAVSGNPLLCGGRHDTTARTLDNGDVGATALAADGSVIVTQTPPGASVVKYANINGNTSGNNTLVAAVASKKIRVLSMLLVAHGDVTCTIEDGAAGSDLSGPYEFDGGSQPKGVNLPYSPVGHFETTANTLLNMALDAAVRVAGHIVYIEV